MSDKYQVFIRELEKSKLFKAMSAEKREAIKSRYISASPEQLDDGILAVQFHEDKWEKTDAANDNSLKNARQNLEAAIKKAKKNELEQMKKNEMDSKAQESELIDSLEKQLNNIQ